MARRVRIMAATGLEIVIHLTARSPYWGSRLPGG
jgi:hypothetical protein